MVLPYRSPWLTRVFALVMLAMALLPAASRAWAAEQGEQQKQLEMSC